MNTDNAPAKAINNADDLTEEDKCGCYHCGMFFTGDKVTEFTDEGKTCLCPECGVDAVLTDNPSLKYVVEAKARWFS